MFTLGASNLSIPTFEVILVADAAKYLILFTAIISSDDNLASWGKKIENKKSFQAFDSGYGNGKYSCQNL